MEGKLRTVEEKVPIGAVGAARGLLYLICVPRVGQNCIYAPYMYTMYDRIYGDFSAKSTPYMYMVLANPIDNLVDHHSYVAVNTTCMAWFVRAS
jgi:hypothetical protein